LLNSTWVVPANNDCFFDDRHILKKETKASILLNFCVCSFQVSFQHTSDTILDISNVYLQHISCISSDSGHIYPSWRPSMPCVCYHKAQVCTSKPNLKNIHHSLCTHNCIDFPVDSFAIRSNSSHLTFCTQQKIIFSC
jgi:hypothetical protein